MKRIIRYSCLASLSALAIGLGVAPVASASEKVDTNVKNSTIMVDGKGNALVRYTKRGKKAAVLYWGAMNADRRKKNTLEFKRDRSAGWSSGRSDYWKTKKFKNKCGSYTGPELPYLVDACTHSDGSHWTLQYWPRLASNGGGDAENYKDKELRLSHFTGEAAQMKITPNWSWGGQYMHIVAELTYQGKPWYAIKFLGEGQVTDKIGRNVTIDSYNSDLGSGWRRVNAILTHRPSGQMCYGFTPKSWNGNDYSPGYSSENRYRLTVPGPGVSPDNQFEFDGVRLEDYNKEADEEVNDYIRRLVFGWSGIHNCESIN